MFELEIKCIEKDLAQLRKMKDLPEPPFRGIIRQRQLMITDFNNLQPAKDYLRENLGLKSWTLDMRWFCIGKFFTSWINGINNYQIWLEISNLEDYPKELQGEKCKWEKTKKEADDYDFTCKL